MAIRTPLKLSGQASEEESHRTGKIIQVTDIANFMTEEPLASVNHWQKLAHSSLSQFTTPSVQRLIHLCITIGASEPVASVASTLLHRCSLISRVLLLLQVKTAAIGSVKTVFETLQLGVLEGKNGGSMNAPKILAGFERMETCGEWEMGKNGHGGCGRGTRGIMPKDRFICWLLINIDSVGLASVQMISVLLWG
ncbi:hypothetical protein FXO37_30350 [Capsicum annuum]|nr:hypothetical protein FXO37_30350 [Capsicum annuum]